MKGRRVMYKRLIFPVIIIVMSMWGCSAQEEETGSLGPVYEAYPSPVEPQWAEQDMEESIPRVVCNIGKSFEQEGVITTVKEILMYPDDESPEYNIICFNLNVRNDSCSDVFMTLDISPLLLNTGEQVDDTDSCDIHRMMKTAVKDGSIEYKVKSSISDIKSIRWILVNPMSQDNRIMGKDCDYTFYLEEFKGGSA
jgi:hypothetical protein